MTFSTELSGNPISFCSFSEKLWYTEAVSLSAFREQSKLRGDIVIKKEMIAMLLAGGQGSRLGVLT